MSLDLSRTRLDRSKPLREQIYPMLRAAILAGEIQPGEVIDEKGIAAQLRVSRTPVREAVMRLSDEHLIDVVAQSGTRAARIDRKEVTEAFLIRRALEMESAAQAAQHMAQDHADRLSDILLQHARAIERRNFVEAIRRDDEFHHYITLISDLPRLWTMIEKSKAPLDRCRHIMLPRAGQAEATLEQHRGIIRALHSGNAEASREAMRLHLDHAFRATEAEMDKPGFGNPQA